MGSNDDFGFEKVISSPPYDCLVHVYDHTSSPPDYEKWSLNETKVRFFPRGLGEGADRLMPLSAMVARLTRAAGHAVVHLAKIDCEGCEFGALSDQRAVDALRSVLHLNLEVHFVIGGEALSNEGRAARMLGLWRSLTEGAKQLPFSKEPNIEYASDCVEYAFVNEGVVVSGGG